MVSFLCISSGFPHSIGSTKNVLKYEIGFQDLEKVLNLAKMHIYKVWKKYKNPKFNHLFIEILFFAVNDSFACFLHCVQ